MMVLAPSLPPIQVINFEYKLLLSRGFDLEVFHPTDCLSELLGLIKAPVEVGRGCGARAWKGCQPRRLRRQQLSMSAVHGQAGSAGKIRGWLSSGSSVLPCEPSRRRKVGSEAHGFAML